MNHGDRTSRIFAACALALCVLVLGASAGHCGRTVPHLGSLEIPKVPLPLQIDTLAFRLEESTPASDGCGECGPRPPLLVKLSLDSTAVAFAHENGLNGKVVAVQALVNKNGRVVRAIVVRSVPALDVFAVAAVLRSWWKPQTYNGRAGEVWVDCAVKF